MRAAEEACETHWNDWSVAEPSRIWTLMSDGGLGEGDPEVMVLSQIVVVELDERLDGLLHRAHLDQSHLVVLPGGESRKW